MSNGMNEHSTISSEKNKVKPTSLLSNKAVLLILSSNFLGKTFIIHKQETIIGRQEDCDIVINDPLISKVHCRIITDDDGKFYLEDMGSKNSTFLNDKAIKKSMHIIYGDRIIIGSTIIRFYMEESIDKNF